MQYVLPVTVPSLMTFTWPGDVPLMALWRGSSGQVRRNGLTWNTIPCPEAFLTGGSVPGECHQADSNDYNQLFRKSYYNSSLKIVILLNNRNIAGPERTEPAIKRRIFAEITSGCRGGDGGRLHGGLRGHRGRDGRGPGTIPERKRRCRHSGKDPACRNALRCRSTP